MKTLNYLLQIWQASLTNTNRVKPASLKSYVSYLNSLDKANGGMTATWILDVVKRPRPVDPVNEALKTFDNANLSSPSLAKWRTAYKSLCEAILGVYFANVWAFSDTSVELELCQLVARNAIFASKDVVDDVRNGRLGTAQNKGIGNRYASWDHMTHVRCKKGGTVPAGCIPDDNTCANHYIKQAVINSYNLPIASIQAFSGYEACHVWDVPYDPRYYASIANLVLVPRAFGQLTDHSDAVKALLRYEVYKRFGFKPDGTNAPAKPTYYNKIVWRTL